MPYPGREEGYGSVIGLLTFSPIKWHFDTKGLTGARLSSKMRPAFGDWRSLVAHFVRDEGVGGSNPLIPTKYFNLLCSLKQVDLLSDGPFLAIESISYINTP